MGHISHLHVPRPWEGEVLTLTDPQIHYLRRVLRAGDLAPITYTDGLGSVGSGSLVSDGIRRGDEFRVARPSPALTVAVAPPRASDRVRFVVEKLSELGVDRLLWLTTDFGQAKAPRTNKAARWAGAALEQSGGAWLMAIDVCATLADLPPPTWVVHQGGGPLPPPTGSVTLVIGPEGGFSAQELARADTTLDLGARVLRVETAAVVASGLVLRHLGRMNSYRGNFRS